MTSQTDQIQALFDAVGANDPDAVSRLLGASPILARMKLGGRTALIAAACHKRVECLALLLPFSDADAVDAVSGSTALHKAALMNCPEAIRVLLPRSNPNAQSPANGRTPLMVALGNACEQSVQLLAPVSDLTIKNEEGETALDIALAWVPIMPEKGPALAAMVRHAAAFQEREAIAASLAASSSDAGPQRLTRKPRAL